VSNVNDMDLNEFLYQAESKFGTCSKQKSILSDLPQRAACQTAHAGKRGALAEASEIT